MLSNYIDSLDINRKSVSAAHYSAEGNGDVLAVFESLFYDHPGLTGCKGAIFAAYLILRDLYMAGNKLLICGNGGSAADAGHIVGELMKGFCKKRPLPERDQKAITQQYDLWSIEAGAHYCYFGDLGRQLQGALPAIDLTQHHALSTAFANDVSPKYIYAQQVHGYGVQGDALLAISTSGNAENCCAAALIAKAKNMSVISLTGPGGGRLGEIADCAIMAPGESTARVQEYHLPVYHTLCAMLEEKMF